MNNTLYFNEAAETLSQDQLRDRQSALLPQIARHVYDNNPVQRQRFQEAGVHPDDIHGVDDLPKLPFLKKDDLRENYPLGLNCSPREDIVEMHMSSGSTGTPVVMPYTLSDIDQWAECMARCYTMAGATASDVIQITPSFGLFNGGFGFFHGARKLGAFIIPTGSGNTTRQIDLARDFGTTVLGGVVSYGIRIQEILEQSKQKLPNLKIGIFGAETFSDSLKKRITEGLGIRVFDIYGMTETGGVGTLGMDCPAREGIHAWEDHYITEIVDPATHLPLPDGEIGELVITSLTRQALPVIRYRTGDLTRIASRERCGCGRTHLRIAPITGRVDDMLIVKGVNFFPRQVEQALLEIPGVLPNYQIIIEEENGVRDVRVNVEANPGVTGFMVEKHLKERLNFSPKGDVFAPGSLPRQAGKAQRVFFKNEDPVK
jgi:phenylacetate-CoA ligase